MVLLCLKIFFARVLDVSLGTLRTIYSVKGKMVISSIIAFLEILIWFLVAKEALNSSSSVLIPISYALGYSIGTLLGTFIANRFVSGLICVQVIIKKNNKNMINNIKTAGYGLSILPLESGRTKKNLLLIEINKKSLNNLIKIIKKGDPEAFMIINETKFVQNGLIK